MVVGIDLGTTKSVIGVWKDNRPLVIPDDFGNRSIPSLVLVTSDEKFFVGSMAQRHPERYKEKNVTINSIKRLMGRRGETGWGWWKTYPQEVSALVLAELRYQAEKYLGQEIKEAVIAIPSHFDESQRRATKEAAEIAGLGVVRLLNEATAAALAYGVNKRGDKTTLIIDFGGGTLDVSVVDMGEGTYQVRCIEGDSRLGGDDFDQVIIDYILEQIQQQHSTKIELNPTQKIVLKEAAEKAKIELSNTLSTSLYIPAFIHFGQNYYDLDVSIDRRTFEQLSQNLLDRAITLVKKALESANLRASGLNALLLIGGSSRIPFIRESIRRELGIEPVMGVDPEICVAQGAIIQAAVLKGTLHDLLLLDALPSSYGIGLQGDKFSKLITKNTTVPTSNSDTFSTTEDNQSVIPIRVYQGENEKASENVFLSTIELRDIPPVAAGIPQIKVTFDIDANMLVHVAAKDAATGKEQKSVIRSPYGLNTAQVNVMRRKLKSWLSERQVWEIESQINPLLSSIETMLSKQGAALDWEEISTLKGNSTALRNSLAKGASYGELQSIFLSTMSIYEKAQQKQTQYVKVIEGIEDLTVRIEKFIPYLRSLDGKAASLLVQGNDLLRNCMQRNLSYNELEITLSSVREGYEQSKAELIIKMLEKLGISESTNDWVTAATNGLMNPSSGFIREHSSKIIGTSELSLIINIMESEDLECQRSIQLKILHRIKKDSYLWAFFVFLVSSFLDSSILSVFEGFTNDERVDTLLVFSLFSALDNNITSEQRKTAAEAIANYLPTGKFLEAVVDCIGRESDMTVSRCLIAYIDRQPHGVFYEFFVNADANSKATISNNKEILIKLVRELNKEGSLFALESLARFPSEEAIPAFLTLVHDENRDVRAGTLEFIIKSKTDDTRIADATTQALYDSAPEIKILALQYLGQVRGIICLPDLLALLQREQDEMLREQAVVIIGNFKDVKIIPYLLKLTMDDSQKVRAQALSSLEKNEELMEVDTVKLFGLIRQVTEKKHSVGITDKIFLWRFSRKYPEMIEVVHTLKKIALSFKNVK